MESREKNAVLACVAAGCALLLIGVVRPASQGRAAAPRSARPEAAASASPQRVALEAGREAAGEPRERR